MQVVLLIAITFVVGAALVAGAELLIGSGQATSAVPAALLCVIPAAVTLQSAVWSRRVTPDFVAAVVLLGIGVRLTTAAVGVFVLSPTVSGLGGSPGAFAEWVAVFYIVTLIAESGLLIRDAAIVKSHAASGCDDGAGPASRR